MAPSPARRAAIVTLAALVLLPISLLNLTPPHHSLEAQSVLFPRPGSSGGLLSPNSTHASSSSRLGTWRAYYARARRLARPPPPADASMRLHVPAPQRLSAGHLPHPPVAVVLVGGVRSFRHAFVRDSIAAHVHAPLRDAGHIVHTFLHVDDAGALTAAMLRPFAPASVTESADGSGACPPRDAEAACPPRVPRLPPMWRSFTVCRAAEAWPVVLAAERAMGRRFAWVVRSRPDVAFLRPLPVPAMLDPGVVHVDTHMPRLMERAYPALRDILGDARGDLLVPQMGDHVAVVARPLAHALFRVVDAYADCPLRALNQSLNAEITMAYWLARNALRVRTHKWFWLLVRDDGRAVECKRVWHLADSKEEAMARFEECQKISARWFPPTPPPKPIPPKQN